jgi:hypothetical protein
VTADVGHELAELAPLVRRAASLDPASLVRVRVRREMASALVLLPFGVLVGRRIAGDFASPVDATFGTTDLLAWLDGDPADPHPARRDAKWHSGLPPELGWRRVETVPDDVVRSLVRAGAQTLKDAAEREGLPGAQPRAEVADVLLDSIVLTAEHGADEVQVNLRLLSALIRMGFLARGSHVAIDLAGRWLRITASYGSVYAERPGMGLGLAPNR